MVHQYTLNGYNIVIDGNSGSIHWVDPITYEVIEGYQNGDFRGIDPQELEEILPEIEELIKDGKIFSRDEYKGYAPVLKERHSVLKAICLHVAHSCNMDCEYCFAGRGEYHDGSGLMSWEIAKKAIDFLVKNSHGRKNLEVDFFGGEPLLNINIVKNTVEYGRSIPGKNFRFTFTTNGMLLDDEIIGFLNREMSNVVISLDGCKKTNDILRRTRDGHGTYDLVLPKFKNLIKERGNKEYYLRGTFTAFQPKFSEEICHLADVGFKHLAIEPVVAPDNAPYAIKKEHLPVIFEEYENLAMEMICRREKKEKEEFTFYHYTIDMEGGPCLSKRLSGCGVGLEYVAVTPEGEIYPCHQFVGEKDYLMGNVNDGRVDDKIRHSFDSCNVYGREECANCFAKLYCSGGCAANGYHATGNLTGLDEIGCELHKKRLECAIMMKIHERSNRK